MEPDNASEPKVVEDTPTAEETAPGYGLDQDTMQPPAGEVAGEPVDAGDPTTSQLGTESETVDSETTQAKSTDAGE